MSNQNGKVKQVFQVKSGSASGQVSTSVQDGGNTVRNNSSQQGGNVVQAKIGPQRGKKKKLVKKPKLQDTLVGAYQHCGRCDGYLHFLFSVRPVADTLAECVVVCTRCENRPTKYNVYHTMGVCPCGDSYNVLYWDGPFMNCTVNSAQFAQVIGYGDGKSMVANAMNGPCRKFDSSIIIDAMAQLNMNLNAVGAPAPTAVKNTTTVVAPQNAVATAPVTNQVPVPVVGGGAAVISQTSRDDAAGLNKMACGLKRYDESLEYGDLFNLLDSLIYGFYIRSQVKYVVKLRLAGWKNLFADGIEVYTPWSDPTLKVSHVIWVDTEDQAFKLSSVKGFYYVDLETEWSVINVNGTAIKNRSYVYGDVLRYEFNGNVITRDLHRHGGVMEFALYSVRNAQLAILPGNRKFESGFGKFLVPYDGQKAVVDVSRSNPYVKLISNGEAWRAASQYLMGKPITSDTTRNVTTVVARYVTDNEALSMIVTDVLRNTVKATKTIVENSADNSWYNWFVRTYRSIKNHNLLVSSPFETVFKPYNFVLMILLLIILKLYVSRRKGSPAIEAPKAKLASASYPLWLIVAMVRRLWDNKIKKVFYTDPENFSFAYRVVRGFRDLPAFPVFEAKCFENVELKEMDDSAEVEEDITGFRCRKSFGNICFGPALQDNIPIVPATCSHNCKVAVVNRGVKKRLKPLPGFWRRARILIRELIPDPRRRVELGFPENVRIDPVKFSEWYKHLSPSSKRGISLVRKHKFTLQPKDARVKGFVKRENTPCFGDKRNSLEFNPRLISGRTFEYQLKTGPITYTLSKTLAVFFGPDNCITYASGMTAEQVGEWFTEALKLFVNAKFCETDASGFDSSVSLDAIKAEMFVYKYLGVQEKHLKALRLQAKTFGFCSNVKYKVTATRKSGDGNTSVGNTTINSLITHCIFRNIPYKAIILGDDGLIIFESKESCEVIADKVKNIWAMAGFTAKVHVFDDPWLAQFCSGRFYPIDGRYKFGMKIFRGLSKIGFSIKDFYRLSDVERHRKGVGLGLKKTVGHIPILRDVAENYIQSTKLDADPIALESHKMAAEVEDSPDESTYTFVSHVYGISRQQITSLESIIRSCRFPSVICVDFLSRCCDIDASERRIPGIASVQWGQLFSNLGLADFSRSVEARARGVMDSMCNLVSRSVTGMADRLKSKATSSAKSCKSWVFGKCCDALQFLCEGVVSLTDLSIEVFIWSMKKMVQKIISIYDDKIDYMAKKLLANPEVAHVAEKLQGASWDLRAARTSVQFALFVNPFAEEAAKVFFDIYAVIAISVLETLPHPLRNMPMVFIQQFVLHYSLLYITRRSYILGSVCHVMWNFLVMYHLA